MTDTAKRLIERTAARKAAGLIPAYGVPKPAPVLPRRALPCVALGPVVERRGCVCRRKDLRTCLRGLGTVSQNGECETCPSYEAEDDGATDGE